MGCLFFEAHLHVLVSSFPTGVKGWQIGAVLRDQPRLTSAGVFSRQSLGPLFIYNSLEL